MNFKIDTLAKKIGLGYTLMAVVLLAAVIVTAALVRDLNQTAQNIANLRAPTSVSSQEALRGLFQSTAALRGWILIKDQKFRDERLQAWEEEIDVSLDRMESLSRSWDAANLERLRDARPLIANIRLLQERIEKLSLTDGEQARALLDDQALPLLSRIKNLLTAMADDQVSLMQDDLTRIGDQIAFLSNIEWLLLAIGMITSVVLGVLVTRSITVPTANAVQVAQSIGRGNLDTNVAVGGSRELESLGDALRSMRDSLLEKTRQTERYRWLSTGQNGLYEAMRGDKGTEELADEIVRCMAAYTDAHVGAVYLLDDDAVSLRLAGRYAFASAAGPRETFRLGEGLVGQAARDQKQISLLDAEEENVRIVSSVVDTAPRHLLVTPFLFEGDTLGVMELGRLTLFTDTEIEYVNSCMESVGISVNSALARKRIQALLEETQVQSEELQSQQEELKQTNEELEEQTQNLKQQQEELQVANEELEEQAQALEAKNREIESARYDIEQKSRQLEISSKYKSEFLANMSHELRTPLNSLLILSKDLAENKNGNLSSDQVECAEIINRSGYDLLELINEVLDLSKIEAGRMSLDVENVSLKALATEIERNFRFQVEQKGLMLDVDLEEGLPEYIQTDPRRLNQILRNLVSNAVKFTDRGSITVAMRNQDEETLAVSIADTGIGLPEDKQMAVFEAFQQAEGGTSRQYGGTGLGLSISRELARLLGGEIKLISTVNEGSVFTLSIPKKTRGAPRQDREARDEVLEKAPADVKALSSYPKLDDDRHALDEDDQVVLIVEDDLKFAGVLLKQAHQKGFKCLAASTGEDGLELARKHKPSAIILDIDLPGIDGHQVLSALKSDPSTRHIPVHIMSVEERSLQTIKEGALAYLTKPVDRQQLEEAFNRIENFIERKMKNLLIVEDDENSRKAMAMLVGNGDVKCIGAGTGREALDILATDHIDCIILDIGLPDISGFELVREFEKVRNDDIPPIIVYTGKELSREEDAELQKYAESIIIKGVKSEERLLDETALFLHRTISDLPESKQRIIETLYDKDAIFDGKTILVVDDDMRNVFALSKILKDRGMEVLKAENGLVAIERLGQHSVDLVLMDVMMPEMDGYEAIQEIRSQKKINSIPIIALTAKAMKDDRRKCIDAGANDYIAKPVDVERLLSLMSVWLSN
jgi:CheY-like chemotaxis protein